MKTKNKFFLGLAALVIPAVLILSAAGDLPAQTEPATPKSTCNNIPNVKGASVCLDNVVIYSNGVQPTVITVCPEPRARVGLFTTCGGTFKVRAAGATPFPEELITPTPTP